MEEKCLLHSHKDIYSKKHWRLCYRASRDGDGADDFHNKCDSLYPSCVIIKSKHYNHVFGAVSHIPFGSVCDYADYVDDPEMKNWIFRLRSDIFLLKNFNPSGIFCFFPTKKNSGIKMGH